MFITKENKNLQVHLNKYDMEELITAEGNIKVTLSPERAKELEDRLETALKEK